MKSQIKFPFLLFIFSLTAYSQQSDLAIVSNDSFYYENDSIKKKNTKHLNEIKIQAKKQRKTTTAVRSGLKPMDNPQSLQVIGSDVIQQQQSIRLSDVVKNANGVYVGSARGGAQESFWSRGYDMSTNNMFKNGFRYNGGSIPEVSSLEKVEFLKGSSALLFGNVAPGGILNMVTKAPLFKSGGEIAMQAGSYSFYKPSIDFYGPLNNAIAYRFIASYEDSESFRDVVTTKRLYFNPSLLFVLGKKTDLLVQGDYLRHNWTPDFGTALIGKEIIDMPRSTYLGATWSTGLTTSSSVTAQLKHSFNENWKLNFNTSYQDYQRTSEGTERIQPSANGDWKRPLGKNDNSEIILGDQLTLNGDFKTGKIKHQLFTGIDYENSTANAYTFGFFNPSNPGTLVTTETATINIFNYDFSSTSPSNPFSNRITQLVTTNTHRFGVFAQDLISLTEKIKVLAGLRWSWQESEATTTKEVIQKINNVNVITTSYQNAVPTTDAKILNRAFSPKIGLVYQPTESTSLFASYSNSFTPNTGTNVFGETLEPSLIDQYELGIKKEFLKGKLTTNVTVYQITNNNLAQTAAFLKDGVTPNANTNIKELVGGTEGRGVEIDITAKPIEGLNINAGYSYNDTKITKTSGTNGSLIEGDRLVRTPMHTANLSFFYKLPSGVLKGLSFGAIGNYIGDRLGGWNDRYVWTATTPATTPPTYIVTIEDRDIPIKGYTTIDASVGYEWRKFSILCKVSNITNELNYTVHENYSVNPIAPRQIMTSLKYKF